jgi:putative oxidoreductase
MKLLTGTNKKLLSLSVLFLRLMTGVILFVAGAGKVLGWFGGMGMSATLQTFQQYMGISHFWTYVSCYAELIGGALLIVGFLTRPAALILAINMFVAVYFLGTKNFFMQNGAAYPFLLFINALAILLAGPMSYSIDAATMPSKKQKQRTDFVPA